MKQLLTWSSAGLLAVAACSGGDDPAPEALDTQVSPDDPTGASSMEGPPAPPGDTSGANAPSSGPSATTPGAMTSVPVSPPNQMGPEPAEPPASTVTPSMPPASPGGGAPSTPPQGTPSTPVGGAGGASGEAPTGGTPATPGGSGPGGAGGATGPGPAAAGCGEVGASFCTDFEGDALPAELTFYPAYLQPNQANFVSIDSSTSHSGSRSLKVIGSDFSQMLGVPTGGATFWGRVHLMSDTDIQNGHNTYVAATDGDGDPNAGEQIRIGEHQCQLEVNRKSDDAEKLSNGGTYECSGGIKLVANTWYCLEFFYDGPNSELQVFVDGAEVPELHVTDWGPYQYSMFKFGFEKYHGDAKTLWYDDVALGAERLGCIE